MRVVCCLGEHGRHLPPQCLYLKYEKERIFNINDRKKLVNIMQAHEIGNGNRKSDMSNCVSLEEKELGGHTFTHSLPVHFFSMAF